MSRYVLLFWLTVFLFVTALPVGAQSVYPKTYKFYMELGKQALDRGRYQEAYDYFRHAQVVAPHEQEPAVFINIIKRIQDGRIEPKPAPRVFRPYQKSRDEIIGEELDDYLNTYRSMPPAPKKAAPKPVRETPPKVETIHPSSPETTGPLRQVQGPSKGPEQRRGMSVKNDESLWDEAGSFKGAVRMREGPRKPPPPMATPQTAVATASPRYVTPPPRPPDGEQQDIIYLDDRLWQTQPETSFRIELRQSVILETKNFQRYLIITPGFIDVQQVDKDRIRVIAQKRGSTLLHVWDDTGRWTFRVEVILPVRPTTVRILETGPERYAEPLRLSYSADWNSYYRGPALDQVQRENLNFLQRALLEGETPYGNFDSHVIFNKFDESTEVTGYGAGLTDGKIGDFKDFSIRGFDLQKEFSPLTLPGQYMRGVLFEAEAFQNNLQYTYVRGRDRAIYGFLAPDVLNKRESFIEGGRVTLFPHRDDRYSLNFARGWGEAREPFLKDRVYSVEAQRRLGKLLMSGELAYDDESTAVTTSSRYEGERHTLTVNLRDLEDDFATVASLPGNRGEVGGTILWNWRIEDTNIDTYLDLYRERFLPNPEAEDTLNVDFNTTVDVPLSKNDRLRTSVYYIDTTGELSAHNNVRLNTVYTKYFQLGQRTMTAFVGMGQQRSRFDLSPASDFDRYSASSGLTVPLFKHLSYYLNYEHSWLYEEQSGDHLRPNVMNTGVNYSRKIIDGWSMYSSFGYRNEENTEGTNSFLAGEDSITGSLGVTFRPNEDFEFFIDGRTRNVWAESEDRAAFNEIDVRAGVRTAWGLPLRWNPKGSIAGTVYKDLNQNQRQDAGEAGIPGVTVEVGKHKETTNAAGFYQRNVRAKSAEVKVDIGSIPDGFVFTTPTAVDVRISPHKTHRVDFGLTARSGVYGIVYYDRNANNTPDPGDEFIAKVKLVLDDTQSAVSDFEGAYVFGGVQPGKHQIRVDIHTIPIQYLPKIKLVNRIEVSEGSTYVFHVPLEKVGTRKE